MKEVEFAFPQFYQIGNIVKATEGMTLRDYFATRAMQAAFAGSGARDIAARDARYDETNWAEVVAANAYEMADAMLQKRKLT